MEDTGVQVSLEMEVTLAMASGRLGTGPRARAGPVSDPAGVWDLAWDRGKRVVVNLRASEAGHCSGGLGRSATTTARCPQGIKPLTGALSQANGGGAEKLARGGLGLWAEASGGTVSPALLPGDKAPQGPCQPRPSGPDHAARLCPPNQPLHLALMLPKAQQPPAEHGGGWGELVATGGSTLEVTRRATGAAQAEGEDQKRPGPLAWQWPGSTQRGSGLCPWLPGVSYPTGPDPLAAPDRPGHGWGWWWCSST